MKTLLLMRHAKSSWKEAGMSDHDRPLNGRGRKDAPRMGRLLVDEGLVPGMVLCSTAVRARETCAAVCAAAGYAGPITHRDELYLAPPECIVASVHAESADADRVLVIAHNPGLEISVSELAGTARSMPTAAIVQIDFDCDDWFDVRLDGRGSVAGQWLPRELP